MKDLARYQLYREDGNVVEVLLPTHMPVRLVIGLIIQSYGLPRTHPATGQPLNYALYGGADRHRLSNEQMLSQTPYANGGELWVIATESSVVRYETPSNRGLSALSISKKTILLTSLLLGFGAVVIGLVIMVLFSPGSQEKKRNDVVLGETIAVQETSPLPPLIPTSTTAPEPITVYAIIPVSPIKITNPMSITLRGSALNRVQELYLIAETRDAPPLSSSYRIVDANTLMVTIPDPPTSFVGNEAVVSYTIVINNQKVSSFSLDTASASTASSASTSSSLLPTSTPLAAPGISSSPSSGFQARVVQSFPDGERREEKESCVSGRVLNRQSEGIRGAILIISDGNVLIEKITLPDGVYRHCGMRGGSWNVQLTFVPRRGTLNPPSSASFIVNGDALQEAIVDFVES